MSKYFANFSYPIYPKVIHSSKYEMYLYDFHLQWNLMFIWVIVRWPQVNGLPLKGTLIVPLYFSAHIIKSLAPSYLGILFLFYTYITQSSWFCLTAMWRGESPWMFTACRSDLLSSSSWAISSQPENAAQWRHTFSS